MTKMQDKCYKCNWAGNDRVCRVCSDTSPATPPNPVVNKPSKPSKYRNVKTEVDGKKFDSKKEAARYMELKAMEDSGAISQLQLQHKIPIFVKDIKVCTYIADFKYFRNGEQIIEDAKGMKTDVYKLKKKLLKAAYGWEIKEI